MSRKITFGDWLERAWCMAIMYAAIGVAILSGFFAILIPAGQVVHWLKFGVWKAWTIADVLLSLGRPLPVAADWIGVQKILHLLLSLPATVGLCLVMLGAGCVMLAAIKALEFQVRRQQQPVLLDGEIILPNPPPARRR